MVSLYDSPVDLRENALTLVRKRFGAYGTIPDCITQSLEVEEIRDHMLHGLLVRMRAEVLGEQLPPHEVTESKTVELGSPVSWWQHFKHAYADRWWMRRHVRKHPIRISVTTEKVTLTARWENFAAYPFSQLVTPAPAYLGQPYHLRWVTTHMVSEREGA
jgi:hypothetical protein